VIESETMRSVKELRSRDSRQGTLRGGLTAVGAERSSNGDRLPGDVALVGPPRTAASDRRGELWGRPMSSNGCLSAEMMMMMNLINT
jgi:hypothetical protein